MKRKIIKSTKPKTLNTRTKKDTWYYEIDDQNNRQYYVSVYKGKDIKSEEYKSLYDQKIKENKELLVENEATDQFYTYLKDTGEMVKFYSVSLNGIDELLNSFNKKSKSKK